MAETVVKTVENVDRLFSQIVVNGEVHESHNYVPSTPSQSVPQSQSAVVTPETQPSSEPASTQGEDIYGVDLNDVLHNFVDNTVPDKIQQAVQSLDVPSSGGSGKYIKSISQTDGKIVATEGDITDSVIPDSPDPVTSGGVYNALGSKANVYRIGSPAGATKYAMIKANIAVLNGILCNRYKDMVLFNGLNGYTIPNMISDSLSYGIKGLKTFTYNDNNVRKAVILIQYSGYAPFMYLKLDTDSIVTVDTNILQDWYDNPDTYFDSIQNLLDYSNVSRVKRIGLPSPLSSDGTYNLQCVVSDGLPSYSWGGLRFPVSSLVYVAEKTYDAVTEDTIDIEAGQYNYAVLPYVPSASIPQGFHIEYVCSWLGGTSGNNKLQVWVNNLLIGEASSYTPDSKFLSARSRAFTKEEIVLEPVLSYSNNGINIKVKRITGTANGVYYLRSLTITAYLVADSNTANRSIDSTEENEK